MSSVAKKTGVSKKVARDRKILGKAKREDRGKPVSAGIHRAAERTGIARPGELEALQILANTAERVFEHDGEGSSAPDAILREALRTAQADIGVMADASFTGLEPVNSMGPLRAQHRNDLALALADYRAQFEVAS